MPPSFGRFALPDVRRLAERTMSRALADVIARAIMRERATIERTLRAAGVPDADVEDIAQEVAYRHALAHLQRAARRELVTADPEDDRTAPSAEDRYLLREATRMAAAAPSRADWRALRAWCNRVPTVEIARREGLTVRSVYSRIHTARVDIRAALRRR